MEEYYIIIHRDPWESGSFALFTENQLSENLKNIDKSDNKLYEIYFSNSQIAYISPEEFFKTIDITNISELSYSILSDIFGYEFGALSIYSILQTFSEDYEQ